MSSYLILLLFIIMNYSPLVNVQMSRMISLNMTCVPIPLAALSSRSDDRFAQLKMFASPKFISNRTATCGKFEM